MMKIVVMNGTDLSKLFLEEKFTFENYEEALTKFKSLDVDGEIFERIFETEAEFKAYQMGIEDGDGWNATQFCILS